jgi:expansin (peptidoglycan-binding protein)
MAKKLKLENFKIQSFITELDPHQENKLKGGVKDTMAIPTNCVYATCYCPTAVTCIYTNDLYACACNDAD